jgi:hypothetical protein
MMDVYARRRAGVVIVGPALALAAIGGAVAQTPKVGQPPEAANMRLVGFNDLQARSAYQPTIHHQGDRWIAYIGHHGGTDTVPKPNNPLTGQPEFNGTSVVDVTDPTVDLVQRLAKGRCECSLSASHLRQCSTRNLECRGPRQSKIGRAARWIEEHP